MLLAALWTLFSFHHIKKLFSFIPDLSLLLAPLCLCNMLSLTKCCCNNTQLFNLYTPVIKVHWKKCYFQGLSKSKVSSKNSKCKLGSRSYNDLPVGYRQVHINWFDLDKCNVCHMDEVLFSLPFGPSEFLVVVLLVSFFYFLFFLIIWFYVFLSKWELFMLSGVREQSVSAVWQMQNDGMPPINVYGTFFPLYYCRLWNISNGFNLCPILLI